MVRQYIGARYVPKFFENPNNTAEWLPNTQYEPLTIVTYGINTYTSKKPVPASVGDPANNPEYWVATANFNSFINELQDQINDINNDVEGIQETLDIVDNRTKKIALYIGNSYVSGYGSTGGTNGIYELTKHLFDDSYKYTAGGLGFVAYTDHANTFLTLLNSAISNLTAEQKNEITHVIFVSAIGDTRALHEGSTKADFTAAISAACTAVRSNFSHARSYVYFADAIARDNISEAGSTFVDEYKIHDIFKENAESCRYTYLGWGGWNCTHAATYNHTDGYHPNDMGYKYLSEFLINSLYGHENYIQRISNHELKNGGDTRLGYVRFIGTPDLQVMSLTGISEHIPSGTNNYIELCDFSSDEGIRPYCSYDTRIICRLSDDSLVWANLYYTADNKLRLTIGAGKSLNKTSPFENFPLYNLVN